MANELRENNITIRGGADGATYTPHVDNNGVLSWTNNKGYPNPPESIIKGKDGESPYVGANGNWWVGDKDTGVPVASGGTIITGDLTYKIEVAMTDSSWEKINGKWQVSILQGTHKITTIHSITAERKNESGIYENMIYSYKRYLTGAVAIIVDEKINMRVIIKGE